MPSATAIPLPKTLDERLQLDEILEVPATLDAYFAFLPGCEYRIDYSDGKIISMGYASLTHEALVGRLIYLLTEALGIDSLRALELLAVVEEHFGIEFEHGRHGLLAQRLAGGGCKGFAEGVDL